MAYKLAHKFNGTFGNPYPSSEDAEQALTDLVAETLETAKGEILSEEIDAAAREQREQRQFSDEELIRLAEARIRSMHSIEMVDDDSDCTASQVVALYDGHDKSMARERARSQCSWTNESLREGITIYGFDDGSAIIASETEFRVASQAEIERYS